jgi:hypothetical protein
MSGAEVLAKRLRQTVQGCTIHQHGPVQAWNAIEDAVSKGTVERDAVALIALEASRGKMLDLKSQGVAEQDPRYRKEVVTHAFIKRLLGEPPRRQHLDTFLASVAIDRDAVMQSKVYERMTTVDDVRGFMRHHVFAVWDFMCLVKALQRLTTHVDLVWLPVGDPGTRRLVNQVVLDEESDEVNGQVASHFELYLEAMREVGADTKCVTAFIEALKSGELVSVALEKCDAPLAARDFVLTTMGIVNTGLAWSIAAGFAIGREEIIPTMFRRLLDSLERQGAECSKLKVYLDRHIAMDGNEHGPAALKLLQSLCGDDESKWDAASMAARRMLKARRQLWDAICLAPQDGA